MSVIPTYVGNVYRTFIIILFNYNNHAIIIFNTRECRWYLMGEGEMKKIAAYH